MLQLKGLNLASSPTSSAAAGLIPRSNSIASEDEADTNTDASYYSDSDDVYPLYF